MTTLQKASVFFVIGILAFMMGFLIDQDREITLINDFTTKSFNVWVAVGLVFFLIGALIPLRKKLGF